MHCLKIALNFPFKRRLKRKTGFRLKDIGQKQAYLRRQNNISDFSQSFAHNSPIILRAYTISGHCSWEMVGFTREVGRGLLMSGYIHSKWLFLQELSVERWRKEALFEGRNRNSFTFLHCCTVLLKMLRNKVLIALFYHLGPQVSKVRWGRIGNKRVGTWAHAVICQTMLSQGGCEHPGGGGWEGF